VSTTLTDDTEEKDQLSSLVAQSTQPLSIRSSIVSRGLQELSEHLRNDTGHLTAESIDQGMPDILGTILDLHKDTDSVWGLMALYPGHVPGFDYVAFLCELQNVSNRPRAFDEVTLAVSYRPKATERAMPSNVVRICLPSRIVNLEPEEVLTGVILEIFGALPDGKLPEECVGNILNGSAEILARDSESGTVIRFYAQ